MLQSYVVYFDPKMLPVVPKSDLQRFMLRAIPPRRVAYSFNRICQMGFGTQCMNIECS